MKKKMVIALLMSSMLLISLNASAEVDVTTQNYLQSLDDRFTVDTSASGSGYSIVLDATDSDASIEQEVHDFFWNVSQLLTEPTVGNDLESQNFISLFLKYQGDMGSFYISDFTNDWEFYTSIMSYSTDAICTPFEGVFEHSYLTTFGGHDYENNVQVLTNGYLTSQGVEYDLPSTYQNICYWAYANFDKSCSVNYTDTTANVTITVDNTAESGSEQKQILSRAMTSYTEVYVFAEDAMPFTTINMKYKSDDDELLFSAKISINSWASYTTEYGDENSLFAEGFTS